MQLEWLDVDIPFQGARGYQIVIFHVDEEKAVDKYFHTAIVFLIAGEPGVLEPEEISVGDDNGGGPARGVVDKLAEIILIILLQILVNVVVVIVVIVESLALVDVLAVVPERR